MSLKIARALKKLVPSAEFSIKGGKVINWESTEPQPSEEEIVQSLAEIAYQDEINEYQRQRAAEYPSYADQFDQIYHEGVDAWKETIQATKDKYPKQSMDADELQLRKDKAIFDLQSERYIKAVERLSQYILSEGKPESEEEIVMYTSEYTDADTGEVITIEHKETLTIPAIEPIEEYILDTSPNPEESHMEMEMVKNPLVVKDEEERAAAQAIIDDTPQEVIDAINN